MTDDEKLLQQALEALEPFGVYGRWGSRDVEVGAAIVAIAALRERLARPVVPPSCSLGCTTECKATLHGCTSECPALPNRPPFAAAPALVPLTEEQITAIVREAARGSAIKRDGGTSLRIARAIEAAHGIRSKT